MKALLKTTGSFMLMEPTTSQVISPDRPHVVDFTQFLSAHTGLGHLIVLQGDLPESASDDQFAEFWDASQGDQALAIASYLSSFEPVEVPVAEKPQRAKGKV